MIESILLSKVIGKNILIRSSITAIFYRINKLNKDDVFMDFKNVKFISRSCAAEYLKLREESGKRIIERNMSDEIKSMFGLVEKQFRKVNFVFTKETLTELQREQLWKGIQNIPIRKITVEKLAKNLEKIEDEV